MIAPHQIIIIKRKKCPLRYVPRKMIIIPHVILSSAFVLLFISRIDHNRAKNVEVIIDRNFLSNDVYYRSIPISNSYEAVKDNNFMLNRREEITSITQYFDSRKLITGKCRHLATFGGTLMCQAKDGQTIGDDKGLDGNKVKIK